MREALTGVREEADTPVVSERQSIRQPATRVGRPHRVCKTHDGPIRGQKFAGVVRDPIHHRGRLGPFGQLERQLVQGAPLVLASTQGRDEPLDPEAGSNLAGQLDEHGARQVRADGRMEDEPHPVVHGETGIETEVQDQRVEIVALSILNADDILGRLLEQCHDPVQAGRARVRTPDDDRFPVRSGDANEAAEGAGLLDHALECLARNMSDRAVCPNGRAHGREGRHVEVLPNDPALGALEEDRHDDSEEHDAAGQDERGEDVLFVLGHGPIHEGEAGQLPRPDQGDRHDDAHPLETFEVADRTRVAHAPTMLRSLPRGQCLSAPREEADGLRDRAVGAAAVSPLRAAAGARPSAR